MLLGGQRGKKSRTAATLHLPAFRDAQEGGGLLSPGGPTDAQGQGGTRNGSDGPGGAGGNRRDCASSPAAPQEGSRSPAAANWPGGPTWQDVIFQEEPNLGVCL